MIPNEWIMEIKQRWPLAHFIVHSPEMLERRFQNATTMAWSIKRGLVLFDKQKILQSFIEKELALPKKVWIQEHLSKTTSWPDDSPGTRTKLINLAILFLELRGIVPTTKSAIRKHFLAETDNDSWCEALQTVMARGDGEREYDDPLRRQLANVVRQLHEDIECLL